MAVCTLRSSRFLSCLLLLSICQAAEPKPKVECDSVCKAVQLIQALYPELKGRNLGYTVAADGDLDALNTSMTGFTIVVPGIEAFAHDPLTEKPKSLPPGQEPLLSGHCQMGGDYMINFTGSLSNWSEFEKFSDLVKSHPEWSDAKILERLKEEGARFTPDQKDALIAQLPLQRLSGILGPTHLDSVDFKIRDNAYTEVLDLGWTISFSVTAQGVTKHFFLYIEPFSGRVVDLFQQHDFAKSRHK